MQETAVGLHDVVKKCIWLSQSATNLYADNGYTSVLYKNGYTDRWDTCRSQASENQEEANSISGNGHILLWGANAVVRIETAIAPKRFPHVNDRYIRILYRFVERGDRTQEQEINYLWVFAHTGRLFLYLPADCTTDVHSEGASSAVSVVAVHHCTVRKCTESQGTGCKFDQNSSKGNVLTSVCETAVGRNSQFLLASIFVIHQFLFFVPSGAQFFLRITFSLFGKMVAWSLLTLLFFCSHQLAACTHVYRHCVVSDET